MLVFFGKDDFLLGDTPVDGEGRIVPCHCTFGGRTVEIIAFVLENDFFA